MIALIVVCYVLVILFAWSLCVAAKRSREAEDRALTTVGASGRAVGSVRDLRRGEEAGSGTLVNASTMAGEPAAPG